MEEVILNLMAHSGEAKSYAMEAINASKNNRFEKADCLLQKANEELAYAQLSQSTLMQNEKNDSSLKISLLSVQAQDQLMTSMFLIDVAKELISLYLKIN
jgi:cellobiose PTS system EIIA component